MTVKISSKFQVVIPEAVRNEMNLKSGTSLHVVPKGNVIFLVPVRTFEETAEKYSSRFSQADLKDVRQKKNRKR